MYSLNGYSDAGDANSEVVQAEQQTVDAPGEGRPSIEDFALGHFEQDWVFVEGSGDLDECNGRFGVTPEFPEGTYHYFITQTYPFVQRCLRGTATAVRRPPGPGRRP